MKLSVLATIAALTTLSACQCTSSIPICAQDCILEAAGSVGCGEADYACQCTYEHQTDIINNAAACLLNGCTSEDLDQVLPAANAFCSSFKAGEVCSSTSSGVTRTLTSVSVSTTVASSGSAEIFTGSDSTRSTSSATSAATTISTGPNQNGGLSTGAKIAIGISFPVVGLIGLAAGFFLFRRRAMKQEGVPTAVGIEQSYMTMDQKSESLNLEHPHEMYGSIMRPELDGIRMTPELDGVGIRH